MTHLGEYQHKVWADEPITTKNEDTGSESTEFVPRERLSCKIEPISGRELLRSDQILADMDTRITTQWSSFAASINAKWRLRFERTGTSITYNIARPPAEKLMGKREIEFVCNSGLNTG